MDEKKFERLLADIRRLIVGLELTNEQGETLITEVRIRMRQPSREVA